MTCSSVVGTAVRGNLEHYVEAIIDNSLVGYEMKISTLNTYLSQNSPFLSVDDAKYIFNFIKLNNTKTKPIRSDIFSQFLENFGLKVSLTPIISKQTLSLESQVMIFVISSRLDISFDTIEGAAFMEKMISFVHKDIARIWPNQNPPAVYSRFSK